MSNHAEHHVSELSLTWQRRADSHRRKQLINPFSEWEGATHRPALHKTDNDYGKPVQNSKTHKRGTDAAKLVQKEIRKLVDTINDMSIDWGNGVHGVRFGDLFTRYNSISNKLVGTLIRARRQGFVDFEGEMLWQHRDDDVIITVRKDDDIPKMDKLSVHNFLSDSGSDFGGSDIGLDESSDIGSNVTLDVGSDSHGSSHGSENHGSEGHGSESHGSDAACDSHMSHTSDLASDIGSGIGSDFGAGCSDLGSDMGSNLASDIGSDVGSTVGLDLAGSG